MKVILLAEVKGKGGEGDVVEVANGFANNYLFPKNLAVAATKGNLKQLEQRKHNIAAREENRIEEANKTKEILDALTVKVEARVGEEGVLFGSVTAQMIADAVRHRQISILIVAVLKLSLLLNLLVPIRLQLLCIVISRQI